MTGMADEFQREFVRRKGPVQGELIQIRFFRHLLGDFHGLEWVWG